MNTQTYKTDDTGTEESETSDPAGVGELATPVVITSSDNANWNPVWNCMDLNGPNCDKNGHCYSVPLRLRGGGDDEDDDEDVEMVETISTSGDMGIAGCSQKRGPPSPGSSSLQTAKLVKTTAKHPCEMSDIIGWLEQTVYQEKDKKKLGVQIAEKILGKLNRLRTLTQFATHENSRLAGELKGKEDAHRDSITLFINKLDAKNAEANSLRTELEASKAAKTVPIIASTSAPAPIQRSTYAAKAATGTVAPKPKTKKSTVRELQDKSRKVKASPRFVLEIPQGSTAANVKTGVWQKVKAKINNPKVKTIVSGKALVIIPDDSNTLEVLRGMDNIIEVGPKKPRVIVYDVDSGISKDELTECLLSQNSELGLTEQDIGGMTPLHKLGPRNEDTVHWVIEVSPSTLQKVENKAIYIGMTRCRCKLHSSLPQCFNCQQYGHTAPRCEQKTPTCRNCAGAHDSRTCSEGQVKCVNCKGPHKASSSTCKSRTNAVKSLLRRTDFGQP